MWTQPEDGETKPGSKWHALKALLLGTVLGAVMMATYEPGSDTIPALQAGDTVEATEKDWASDIDSNHGTWRLLESLFIRMIRDHRPSLRILIKQAVRSKAPPSSVI